MCRENVGGDKCDRCLVRFLVLFSTDKFARLRLKFTSKRSKNLLQYANPMEIVSQIAQSCTLSPRF